MKKIHILILFIIIILFFFLFIMIGFSKPLSLEKIGEEAFPIRDLDTIMGMEYVLTIYPYVKDSSLTVSSHILESILHYKDPSLIHDFFIRISIHNQSKYDYLLKSIRIIDTHTNLLIEEVSYEKENNNIFRFHLSEDFFHSYHSSYKIQIELEK